VPIGSVPPGSGAGRHRALVPALALVAALLRAQGADAAPAPCRALSEDGNSYTVCEVDLRRDAVRLFWKRPDGVPYGYLSDLPPALGARADPLRFALNAGMFQPDYRPAGLYIENGRELGRASTRPGHGNFHMKPNGVFYVAGESAGIAETGSFLRQRPHADFATQSGPMLVIDGRLHPRFAPAGGSRKVRSGVGVRDEHTIVFAISDGEVSFGEFARLFRDRLACDNALFLDGGSVPSLYAPDLKRSGNLLPLGPMIAVYARNQ
jgi:uncharacterized protein YigE (DUF2233 family)